MTQSSGVRQIIGRQKPKNVEISDWLHSFCGAQVSQSQASMFILKLIHIVPVGRNFGEGHVFTPPVEGLILLSTMNRRALRRNSLLAIGVKASVNIPVEALVFTFGTTPHASECVLSPGHAGILRLP